MSPVALWRFKTICHFLLWAALFNSCNAVYFKAMEKAGIPKRDILVSRVKKARHSQEEAKEEFQDALQEFMSVVEVDGGELEEKYNKLNARLERSESRAQEVRDRIAKVEGVADALFREWKTELDQYKNAKLRRESERQYHATQRRYEDLLEAMHNAEDKMDPVLEAFRDQVLFLKHNLNSRAIASIKKETRSIENDVENLVKDMEEAIHEADSFIAQLGK